jgi:hypothetical protein
VSETSKLSELGVDPARLTTEQRNVLDSLSAEEISTIASVKRRLETAEGDVQGHSVDVGVLIF